tara:strand:+ start:9878 stop:11203 length:1326 start_codon:yes stop_codon:yes gene_type:complete
VASLIEIIVLLCLNAFFVAAEFALVKARGVRIASIAAAGNSAANMTVRIQGNLEAYLAACQLGITMASLGLGWVGEPAVAAILEPLFSSLGLSDSVTHTVAFITGFLIFSSLHIVVGEQVPKTFAIRRPERVSLAIAYPLHLAYLMVWPLNWALNRTSGAILSLFRVEEATHGEIFTDEELKDLVSASRDHGNIELQKADMLRNLFEFDQHDVQRVMIPRHAVCTLDIALDAATNQRIAFESGHSRFPLIDSSNNNRILGVVLLKTIYRAQPENGGAKKDAWSELEKCCRSPLVVPETQKSAVLFELMREQRNHIALVVDEYGQLSGIVTLEDLLEKIVGDIEDETDADGDQELSVKPDGDRWLADGLTTLSTVERFFGIELADDIEANSISGLLMQRLERMPVVGDAWVEHGYQFRVAEIRGSRVGQVEVSQLSGPHIPH